MDETENLEKWLEMLQLIEVQTYNMKNGKA